MLKALVITPVKDSLHTTKKTIEAIHASKIEFEHIVYNDFSHKKTKDFLSINNLDKFNYKLVNIEDFTNTPSPNYKFILKDAQKIALKKNIPLIIVESDVNIKPNTFDKMLDLYAKNQNIGLIGAITVDSDEKVNYPYLKFRKETKEVIKTKRSLSFCCTLLSVKLLEGYNFENLDALKNWYDTYISKKANELKLTNYILRNVTVEHQPHSSRPWKQLKYKNRIKYYFLKIIKKRDKI